MEITDHTPFRNDFGEPVAVGATILPAIWLGLWNGLVQAGIVAGSILAGWFQDRFGRRPTFFLGGVLGVMGTTASYTSGMPHGMDSRRGVFLLAKTLIGLGCGMLMAACQTYISEIAPKNLRGVLLGFYAFNVVSLEKLPFKVGGFDANNRIVLRPHHRLGDRIPPNQQHDLKRVPDSFRISMGLWRYGYGHSVSTTGKPRLAHCKEKGRRGQNVFGKTWNKSRPVHAPENPNDPSHRR